MALVGLLFNCVFKWVFNLHVGEDAKSHWLHLFVFSPLWALYVLDISFITVNLSNAPSNEIACLKGYNTTLAAVICWANFALSPKCIFFNMYPQMDSPRVCSIATIIVFVKTFPTLCYDLSPKITYLSRYIIALVAIFNFSPVCLRVLKWPALEESNSNCWQNVAGSYYINNNGFQTILEWLHFSAPH